MTKNGLSKYKSSFFPDRTHLVDISGEGTGLHNNDMYIKEKNVMITQFNQSQDSWGLPFSLGNFAENMSAILPLSPPP